MVKIRIYVRRRVRTSLKVKIVSASLSTLAAVVAIVLMFHVLGVDPLYAFNRIYMASLGSYYGISETITKSIPLLLCGVGLAVAYKAKVWNIGAEGQLLMGAIVSGGLALFTPLPPQLAIPIIFLGGFIGGALWALIPAVLKAKFQVNEVITTLMMNYIAERILLYLVYGPWRGKEVWGFPFTSRIPSYARLPVVPGTRIHYPTLIIGLVSAVLLFFMLSRTTIGFKVRVIGESIRASNYAGIEYSKIVILVMIISGGLAGLAGAGEVAGIQHMLRKGISPGYGFTAIIVAWLGNLNPLLVIASSLLIASILVGGDAIQISIGLSSAFINLFNGTILIFLLLNYFLSEYEIIVRR